MMRLYNHVHPTINRRATLPSPLKRTSRLESALSELHGDSSPCGKKAIKYPNFQKIPIFEELFTVMISGL